MRLRKLVLIVLFVAAGCQKKETPPPPPPPPGQGSAAVVPAPPAEHKDERPNQCDTSGASCNALPLQGVAVDAMQVDTAPPPPTGGKIPPGIYSLVGTTIYTGPGGAKGPTNHPERMTIQLTETPTGMIVQDSEAQQGCPDKHETNTLTFSGSNVAAVRTCPPCNSKTDPYCEGVHTYTWTGTQLIEFIHQENSTWARTFSLVK